MNARILLRRVAVKSNSRLNAKEYTCQFWEPGLVSYEDSGAGVALLRKEAMDGMLASFVGKPVVIEHMEGTPEEIFNSGKAVGKVTEAHWNPDTGWYECTFTVDNEEAQDRVDAGWSVSCAFDVSQETGPGGEYHAMRYDEEITSGEFTHLALVQNPRYEESKIFKNHKMFLNSKGAKMAVKNASFKVGNPVEVRTADGGVSKGFVTSVSGSKAQVKYVQGPKKGLVEEVDVAYLDYTIIHGNAKENSKLAEEIIANIPAANITEQACVSYALEKGLQKIDGQNAWQEIFREMRKIQKNARVILKPAKQNTKEKNFMFGLFKRKSKKNEAPVEEKLPMDQIDIEIDGVAVPLTELVQGFKAEQAEITEKKRLEEEAAKNADPAEGNQPQPEDLNLDNEEFSVEDGSRFNMQDLIASYQRRAQAKQNSEEEARAKAEAEKKAAEEAAAKENSGGWQIVQDSNGKFNIINPDGGKVYKEGMGDETREKAEDALKDFKAGWERVRGKGNSQETDEEKAAREKKEADDEAAKENAAQAEEEAQKKAEEEAKAKENAKKRDPKFFHKMNDLKNGADEILGKAVSTTADRIARGNERYGAKKK